MHPIIKSLLKTFIIATILATGVNSAVYAFKMQGISYDHMHTAIKIGIATLILTVVLFVLSLPSLLLILHRFWKPAIIGFLLYFSGPILFVIAFVIMRMDPTDQLLGQITGLLYLAVTTVFYYLVTRDYRRKHGRLGSISAKDRLNSRIDPSR